MWVEYNTDWNFAEFGQEIIADFEQWAIHHAGIVRLLNMRGGIDSITFRPLRETISWCGYRT